MIAKFSIQLNSNQEVVSISAASRADYIQMVHDYKNNAKYQDQYDLDTFADALIDASEDWLDYNECEQLYMRLGLA